MKITLSKEDIEEILKEYYEMESVAWDKDGNIIIDTTLEKITNEKNDLSKLKERIRKKPTLFPRIQDTWPAVQPLRHKYPFYGTITDSGTYSQTKHSPKSGALSKFKSPPVKI